MKQELINLGVAYFTMGMFGPLIFCGITDRYYSKKVLQWSVVASLAILMSVLYVAGTYT